MSHRTATVYPVLLCPSSLETTQQSGESSIGCLVLRIFKTTLCVLSVFIYVSGYNCVHVYFLKKIRLILCVLLAYISVCYVSSVTEEVRGGQIWNKNYRWL